MPARPVVARHALRSVPRAVRHATIAVLIVLAALTPGAAGRSPDTGTALTPPDGTGAGHTVLGLQPAASEPQTSMRPGLAGPGTDGAPSPADAPTLAAGLARPSGAPALTVAGRSGWAAWSSAKERLYSKAVLSLYEPSGGQDGPGVAPEVTPEIPPGPPSNGPDGVVITIPQDAPVPRGPGGHRSFPNGPPPLGTVHGQALEVDDARLTLTASEARLEGLLWPVYRAGTISQLFHAEHPAIDISAAKGTPLLAPYAGVVVFRQYRDDRCANAVWIEHGPSFFTSFCHLWRFSGVQAGDWVEQGAVIGYIGSSGYSTGPHVHFGVSVAAPADSYAYRLDPLLFLRQR